MSIFLGKFRDNLERAWRTNTAFTRKGLGLLKVRDSLKQFVPIRFKRRREEVVLYRLRIGHVGVQQHMRRFNMAEESDCEECGVPDSVEHLLLYCCKYEQQRSELRIRLRALDVPSLTVKCILGGSENRQNCRILQETVRFIKSTNLLGVL